MVSITNNKNIKKIYHCPKCNSTDCTKMGFAEAYSIVCRNCNHKEEGND